MGLSSSIDGWHGTDLWSNIFVSQFLNVACQQSSGLVIKAFLFEPVFNERVYSSKWQRDRQEENAQKR